MKKKLPIIIIAIAVAAVFVVYFFVIRPGQQTELTPEEQLEEERAALAEVYYFIPGEYFVTNVADSTALVKVSISLGLTGDDQTEFLTTNMAVIRNQIVKILLGYTEDALRDPSAIGDIEAQIKTALEQTLLLDGLQHVYISDFVIQ